MNYLTTYFIEMANTDSPMSSYNLYFILTTATSEGFQVLAVNYSHVSTVHKDILALTCSHQRNSTLSFQIPPFFQSSNCTIFFLALSFQTLYYSSSVLID